MDNELKNFEFATFAGGCFWCTTSAFDGRNGIYEVVSGYTGGHIENPTYEQVCSGTTGHYEAVRIKFAPRIIDYTKLLEIFFKQIDPTDNSGSFLDRGTQYRSAVFYHNEEQKNAAARIIRKIDESGLFDQPVATKIIKAADFYEAEAYHQGYHKKNAIRYKYYRAGSGRDIFINDHKKKYHTIFDSQADPVQ